MTGKLSIITSRQRDILVLLKKNGPMNVHEIGLLLKIHPKTVKGYLRNLQRMGLIEYDGETARLANNFDKAIEVMEREIEELKSILGVRS